MITLMSIRRRSILDPGFCVWFARDGVDQWDETTFPTREQAQRRARTIWAIDQQYQLYQKYRVEAGSVADFLTRYYKADRYTGRGAAYAATLLASYEAEVAAKGYCIICHYDSVTGQCVSYYTGTTL